MKKDKTEKKEKKERKEGKLKSIKESGAGSSSSSSSSSNRKLTADELLRLDEMRRSLKIRTRRKDKEKLPSGITADYTANFNLATDDQQPPSSNSETSLNSLSKDASAASAASAVSVASLPPPPLAPARGILKGKSSYGLEQTSNHDLEDDKKLVENTLKNELIIYEKPPAAQKIPPVPHVTTAVYNAPAGEGYGWPDSCSRAWKSTLGDVEDALCLPPLAKMALPEPRDLKLFRKDTGDFGFSLRRSIVVEKPSNHQPDNRFLSFFPLFPLHITICFYIFQNKKIISVGLEHLKMMSLQGRVEWVLQTRNNGNIILQSYQTWFFNGCVFFCFSRFYLGDFFF